MHPKQKEGKREKHQQKNYYISNFGFQATHTTTFGLMENMGTICEWYKAVSFDQVKDEFRIMIARFTSAFFIVLEFGKQ